MIFFAQVFSNLPGPDQPLMFCGEVIQGMQVIFPNLIPQALLISYNGGIYFNMSVDPAIMPAHKELPRLFLEECAELAKCYGIEASLSDMVQA
jgi:hypothetical protein